jgi:hypothetical protein
LSVFVVRTVLVPVLVAVRVAPTTAAPDGSVTFPTRVAVVCCAPRERGRLKHRQRRRAVPRQRLKSARRSCIIFVITVLE